jgi:hypothetical protein
MPWFTATVIDQNKKTHRVELFAGCTTNVKQLLMARFGVTRHKYGAPIGGKMNIIVKDIIEIPYK